MSFDRDADAKLLLDQDVLFKKAHLAMEKYLRDWYCSEREDFWNEFHAAPEVIISNFSIENECIHVGKDFFISNLEYVSVSIALFNPSQAKRWEYTAFYSLADDFELLDNHLLKKNVHRRAISKNSSKAGESVTWIDRQ